MATRPRAKTPTEREGGTVVKVPGLGYFVKSRTAEGGWWLIDGNGCSCPATVRDCWHVRRAYEWEQEHGPAPRPTAPPNISALVD